MKKYIIIYIFFYIKVCTYYICRSSDLNLLPWRGYIFKALAHMAQGLRKVWPKGGVVLSFPPSSFDNFYQNGTNIDQQWDQFGPGGRRGTRKSTKYEKINVDANNQNAKNLFV